MSTATETLQGAKTARLDLKTTEFAKEFIRKAATISGLDMTSFILASAFEKAEAVMETYHRIELSEKAFARAHALSEQSEASPTAHKNLVKLFRSRNERSRTHLRTDKPE
jgi:uncharacterized protein (DUF1778 family)